jgi:tRNA(Ile2) C34 agmatinyltransferase TiaS
MYGAKEYTSWLSEKTNHANYAQFTKKKNFADYETNKYFLPVKAKINEECIP